MKSAIFGIGCALIAVVVLSGCVKAPGATDGGMKKDMNMQEAADRADGILDSTLRVIDPEVHWAHGSSTAGSCSVTRRRTIMTVISADRRGNLLGLVDRYWRRSGYRITSTRNDAEVPALYARTGDGFGIALIVGGEGQVFFEADTPCVQESEVSDPTAQPNTPSYEGMENIPRPNIHSDFWSATGAVGATEPANPATS